LSVDWDVDIVSGMTICLIARHSRGAFPDPNPGSHATSAMDKFARLFKRLAE
jgi:hypothetical protein